MKNTIDLVSNSLQSNDEQPTSLWKFFALHSSHTEKIIRNDWVILADLNPLSSPTRSSLLQCKYGFSDNSFILLASNFLRCLYFWACFKNSGEKYVL